MGLVPRRAVTVGLREVLASRPLCFYCNRPLPSVVVRKAFHGPLTPECPGSFLGTRCDATLTMADFVAAPPNIPLR